MKQNVTLIDHVKYLVSAECWLKDTLFELCLCRTEALKSILLDGHLLLTQQQWLAVQQKELGSSTFFTSAPHFTHDHLYKCNYEATVIILPSYCNVYTDEANLHSRCVQLLCRSVSVNSVWAPSMRIPDAWIVFWQPFLQLFHKLDVTSALVLALCAKLDESGSFRNKIISCWIARIVYDCSSLLYARNSNFPVKYIVVVSASGSMAHLKISLFPQAKKRTKEKINAINN